MSQAHIQTRFLCSRVNYFNANTCLFHPSNRDLGVFSYAIAPVLYSLTSRNFEKLLLEFPSLQLFILCSLLSLWIAELLMRLTLSQKFRWWRVAWSTESKRKKSLFPLWPYFLTASLFPPCLLFFAPSPLSERWNRLAGASLACGHEKDGHQNYDFLFQGSRAGITVLPYPGKLQRMKWIVLQDLQ